MKLFIFILVSVSITNIITSEFIFEDFRNWWEEKLFPKSKKLKYLISCPVCTGFWIGLFTSFLFGIPFWIAPFITSIFCKLLLILEGNL